MPLTAVFVAATVGAALATPGPVNAAPGRAAGTAARTVIRTDPAGDVSPAALDIVRARMRVGHRVTVTTTFAGIRSGTGYVAFADPGRRGGGLFRLEVRVRRNHTSTGRVMWHAAGSGGGHFVTTRCAGLRTSVDLDAASLRVSAPSRCLQRHTRLGGGIWFSLNSFALPLGPASGDLLPDSQSRAVWVPRG
jgi:hypothetical protein